MSKWVPRAKAEHLPPRLKRQIAHAKLYLNNGTCPSGRGGPSPTDHQCVFKASYVYTQFHLVVIACSISSSLLSNLVIVIITTMS